MMETLFLDEALTLCGDGKRVELVGNCSQKL